MISSILCLLRQAVLFAVLSAATWPMAACSGGGGGSDAPTYTADWIENQLITYQAGTATIELDKLAAVGVKWSAEIVDRTAEWISFTPLPAVEHTASGAVTGTLSGRLVRLYYAKNNTAESRSVLVRLTYEGQTPIELSFEQSSEVVWSHPEMPQRIDGKGYRYATHYCKVMGREQRNYSLCFDPAKRAAYWVAYPMHSTYLGSGRIEHWEYDPKLPQAEQPVLYKGYQNGTTWNRGHQIPNADRNATSEMQDQTFYFSNMTPQMGSLNSQGWMRLESKVRDWKCSDTLYVVTGAWWDGTTGTTRDNAGNDCPIPSHYFKVLARTKSGNTRTRGDRLGDYKAAELMTIGFWVKNASGQGEAKDWVMSVQEIEQKTGFTFFPSLPAAAKTQREPSQWNL